MYDKLPVFNKYDLAYGHNRYLIKFYKDMYNSYKDNIGKRTINNIEITDKMVMTIKKRLNELEDNSYNYR